MAVAAPEAPAPQIQHTDPPAEAQVSTDFIRSQFEAARAEIPEMRTAQEALDRRNAKKTGKTPPSSENIQSQSREQQQHKAVVEDIKPAKVEPEKPTEEVKAEATAETPTEETETVPPGLDPKAQETWTKIKKENKLFKAKATELENKLKEVSTASEELTRVKADLQARERQIEEYNKELYLTRIEATPEWKKTVVDPANEIIDQVEFLAKRHSLDPNKILEAIDKDSRGDSAPLEELLSGLTDREKNRYYPLSENLIQIDKRKGELKKNSKEAYETSMRAQQEEQTRLIETQSKELQKAANVLGEKFSTAITKFLPDDHQVNFDILRAEASKGFEGKSIEEHVYSGYAAAVLPDVLVAMEAKEKKIADMQEQLNKYRSASPKSNTQGTAPDAPQQQKPAPTRKELASQNWDDMAQGSTARMRANLGMR